MLFNKNGNVFRTTEPNTDNQYKELPAAIYTVKYNDMTGEYYLEITDPFVLPKRYYGDTIKIADRIINTYQDRPNSTGVMLSGEKGSGKTLLSKTICMKSLENGVPTLLVNSPFFGEEFNSFMQGIEQDCIVLFDEFEKVFNNPKHQEQLLTLLDGVYPSHKMFIFTINEEKHINDNLRNRPGRIFYYKVFEGLGLSFIEEYANDNLNNKDNIRGLLNVSCAFYSFNFDMLAGIVQEMNRYNETAYESVELLNCKPTFDRMRQYGISIEGQKEDEIEYRNYRPLTDALTISMPMYDKEGEFTSYKTITLTPDLMTSFDLNKGAFVYTLADNTIVNVKEHVENPKFAFKNMLQVLS